VFSPHIQQDFAGGSGGIFDPCLEVVLIEFEPMHGTASVGQGLFIGFSVIVGDSQGSLYVSLSVGFLFQGTEDNQGSDVIFLGGCFDLGSPDSKFNAVDCGEFGVVWVRVGCVCHGFPISFILSALTWDVQNFNSRGGFCCAMAASSDFPTGQGGPFGTSWHFAQECLWSTNGFLFVGMMSVMVLPVVTVS